MEKSNIGFFSKINLRINPLSFKIDVAVVCRNKQIKDNEEIEKKNE